MQPLSSLPEHHLQPSSTFDATIVTANILRRITIKLESTATSTVITRRLPLTNYISGADNETLRPLLGHTNGNIETRSPSAAAMMTMVAAATIARFPPVISYFSFSQSFRCFLQSTALILQRFGSRNGYYGITKPLDLNLRCNLQG